MAPTPAAASPESDGTCSAVLRSDVLGFFMPCKTAPAAYALRSLLRSY